jgi:hypothetical protein
MKTIWPTDSAHQLILGEAQYMWKRAQRFQFLTKVLDMIFRSQMHAAISIEEYAQAESVIGKSDGTVIGHWVYDKSGIRGLLEDDSPTGCEWNRLKFHVNSETNVVTLNYFFSPHGGFGYVAKIETEREKHKVIHTKSWIF